MPAEPSGVLTLLYAYIHIARIEAQRHRDLPTGGEDLCNLALSCRNIARPFGPSIVQTSLSGASPSRRSEACQGLSTSSLGAHVLLA